MTTRNGKIARLPKQVRHDLNGRLEDGEPGKQLVEWLNGLPEVQGVLQLRFGGRPISEQNLSERKQGSYQEWLKLQPNQTESNPIMSRSELPPIASRSALL